MVPVVNENDAIANDELRYGDNDRIAALIANSVGADVLVLLTDMDGVFTADPRRDSSATLIPFVNADDPLLAISADTGGSGRGSGGMASKLVAARMASWSGIRSVIARASRRRRARRVGVRRTRRARRSHRTTGCSRRASCGSRSPPRWPVRSTSMPAHRRALTERPNSLLPAGRDAASTVSSNPVRSSTSPDRDGTVFARGIASTGATALSAVLGRHTSALPEGMANTVIHRDDLVIVA